MQLFNRSRAHTQDMSKEFMTACDITTFGYRKFYSDGRNYGFSTNENLDANFSDLMGKPSRVYAEEVGNSQEAGYGLYKRSGKPTKNDSMLLDLCDKFNTWNTLAIYKKGKCGAIEGFYFASQKEKKGLIDQSQELLPLVHNHILSFKKDVLASFTEEGLATTYFPRINYAKRSNPLSDKDVSLKTVFFSFPDGEICNFPLREAQCLVNSILGRSAKDIGKKLNISYRTVETYLQRAYRKFSSIDSVEISKCLLTDPFNYETVRSLYL